MHFLLAYQGIKMNTVSQEQTQDSTPAAVFIGDFNTGKSYVINALLRQPLLFTSREESLAPPVVVCRGDGNEPIYAGRSTEDHLPVTKSHAQLLGTRQVDGQPCDSDVLAVLAPGMPFRQFVLVDTPGASSEKNKSAILAAVPALERALFVLTTTIEYWPARHTMALIHEYHLRFPGRFIVVANMADQANVEEIRRIREKARHRMESNGISQAPPFFVLSARLELARQTPGDEYRRRVRPEVRELCDAGFDAFRVALYEFEARVSTVSVKHDAVSLLQSPLAGAVITNQKGSYQ